MPNEINVCDQEMETILQSQVVVEEDDEEEEPTIIKKKEAAVKKTELQPTFPGFEKFMVTQQQPADMATNTRLQVKRVIEALLFASSEPLPFQKIKDITDTIHDFPPRTIRSILQNLQDEYLGQQRAFRLEEIAQGFVLRTCEEYSPYIEQMGRNKRTEKLSQASAEVLAIIAYKQPITRPQIDAIRGVDSSGTVFNLLERQLIQPVGKLEAPGRPTLYGITKDFLKHYGLKDLNELPKIE